MKNILVIENNESTVRSIIDILPNDNYSVARANNDKEATDCLSQHQFNLVILDESSSKTLIILREKYSFDLLPVVMICSSADENKINKFLAMGANDFIAEPISGLILKTKVKNLLELQGKSEELNKYTDVLKNIIDNTPILSVIVNDNVSILNANNEFSDQFGPQKLNRQKLFGNVVNCINAVNSNGQCGKTDKCKTCVVRNSITETFITGKNVHKREGTFVVQEDSSVSNWLLQVSTTKIVYQGTPSVLASINDITKEKQYMQNIEEAWNQYQTQAKETARLFENLKEANGKLAESEARYKLISDYSNDWEVYRDKDDKLIYCSPGVERVLGYTVDEYVNTRNFADVVYPEDFEYAMATHKRRMAGEAIPSCIFRMVKKNGDIVWVDLWAQPVKNETGELLGVRASFRDVTELKETELALEENRLLLDLAFHYSNDWEIYRHKDKIIYCSEAIETIVGYTVEEYLSRKVTLKDIFHPDDALQAMEDYQKMMNGQPRKSYITRFVHKDGHTVWIDGSARPVFSNSGEMLGVRFSVKDITKLKEAEFALQESETRYRLISDYSYGWEVFRDKNNRLVYCSPGVERVMGYTVEEYQKGIPLEQIFHPDDLETGKDSYKRALAGEKVGSSFFRMIKKNKEIIWVDVSTFPIILKNDEFVGFRASIRDITKQKEIELALEESRSLLDLVFHYSNDWEVYRDMDNKLIYCSLSIEQLLGYTMEEYIAGKVILKDIIHPDEWEKDMVVYSKMLTGETVASFITRYVRKDKKAIWVDVSSRPVISSNGERIGTRISAKDITQLKETEFALKESRARYKLISDYSNDWEVYRDQTGEMIYCSLAVERILGYTVDEFMQDLPFSVYIHPDDIEIASSNMEKLINRGKITEHVYRFIKKNGELVYLDIQSQPVITDDGEYRGFRLSGRDVTEKVILEQKLRESNATKDKFFSIISHDLKSPFNSLFGFSELLLETHAQISDEKREEYISYICNTSKSTLDLLENLLTWSRSQSGKINVKQKNISLKLLSAGIINLNLMGAQNKKIKLTNTINEDINVFADENMLNAVIQNLIANSIKYTAENGTIILSAIVKDDFAEISVVDNGVGMGEDIRNSLFRLAETKSTPGTNHERGTGLGLILCKEFVERQGGKIWAESQLGKGSKFKFTIPLYTSR